MGTLTFDIICQVYYDHLKYPHTTLVLPLQCTLIKNEIIVFSSYIKIYSLAFTDS